MQKLMLVEPIPYMQSSSNVRDVWWRGWLPDWINDRFFNFFCFPVWFCWDSARHNDEDSNNDDGSMKQQ